MQPDSLIPDPSNPQAWNRYSYVYNNPIKYSDPTGHSVACDPYEDDCHSDSQTTNNDDSNENYRNNDEGRNCKGLECLHSRDENDITLPTNIPSATPPPPNDTLKRQIEFAAGLILVGAGFGIISLAAGGLAATLIEALAVTTTLTPLGLLLDSPHLGIAAISFSVLMVIGAGTVAAGALLIKDSLKPNVPASNDN